MNHSAKHHRTKIIPLRWIGNCLGSIAGNSLVKAVYLEEDGNLGYRFKFHSKVWHYLNKPYELWGTYYVVDMDAWREDLTDSESSDS